MSEHDDIRRVADALIRAWDTFGEVPFPLYRDEAEHLAKAALVAVDGEVARLRAGYEAIKRATIAGRVCDDVAWFDDITTLHDFCDEMLNGGSSLPREHVSPSTSKTTVAGASGDGPGASRFTAQQKSDAADREVKQRLHVYPRLIATGRMSREKADYEADIMRAIAADYHALALKERLL